MEKLKNFLDEITLGLQSDGADLDVLEISQEKLVLAYSGNSKGLQSLNKDPKDFISKLIKKEFPEVGSIEFRD